MGGEGEKTHSSLSVSTPISTQLPAHLELLWVPVPTVRAGSPQRLLKKAGAFLK